MKKIAFVIPWYSDTIHGGAESACRTLAKTLQSHGANLEILTTCVKNFRADWSHNYYPEGPATEGGVPVRRFRVASRNQRLFDEINARLMQSLALTAAEEQTFLDEMLNCPRLYQFIEENRSCYVFLLLPYLFSTTYWGVRAAGENAVLIPCLHDEAYARLPAVHEMFRQARGVIFLSTAERDLARHLYSSFQEIGVFGLPLDCNWSGDAARFLAHYGLGKFLLYAGRVDTGKNAELLIGYFEQYVEETGEDTTLVFMGVDRLPCRTKMPERIRALGVLSEQEKHDCFAAALALCVPSTLESFSIVMMESWIAGRPVIVNERCAVTTGFCRESNGGLWFSDYYEFREIVQYLRENPKPGNAMGQCGAAFVRDRFEPAAVARNYLAALEPFMRD